MNVISFLHFSIKCPWVAGLYYEECLDKCTGKGEIYVFPETTATSYNTSQDHLPSHFLYIFLKIYYYYYRYFLFYFFFQLAKTLKYEQYKTM